MPGADARLPNPRANYDATVATYRQTSLTAFQEVEDNLAALRILENEAHNRNRPSRHPRIRRNFLRIVIAVALTPTCKSSPPKRPSFQMSETLSTYSGDVWTRACPLWWRLGHLRPPDLWRAPS